MSDLRDYDSWHDRYDDPGSDLSWRLSRVQEHIEQFLDKREGPVRILSVCSGDGRDLLQVLAAREDTGRITATLLELHPALADRARSTAATVAPEADVAVQVVDAGRSDAYVGAVPADLVFMTTVKDQHAQHSAVPATARWRHSRQVAGAVGICLLTSSSSSDARDCSITHAAESFGYTTGPFTPELAATCRALIGDLTGMTDPTAGGRLRVEVLSYNANGDLVTSTQQRKATDTSQACMVNGDGRSYLKGSLLALGSHAVPFG